MPNIKYFFLSFLLWPLVSISADKHVHGEAEIFIAIEGNQVLLELQSPADNIVGFEHAPMTQNQFSQLEESLVKLRDQKNIVTFSEDSCQQISAEVKSPFEDDHKSEKHKDGHSHANKKHDHKEHNHDKHSHKEHKHEEHTHEEHSHKEHKHEEHSHKEHNHDKDYHSDFYASYTLECERAENNITSVEINAFSHFAGIKNITVKWVTSNKQGSAKATASNKVINLK